MDALVTGKPASASRLRGRQAEIDTLRGRLDAVRAGRGGTVLVTGLAGMGKTVLLDVAEQMARELKIQVLRGAGHVAAQVIPLSPLLEALVAAPGRRWIPLCCTTSANHLTSGSGWCANCRRPWSARRCGRLC